MGYNPGYNVASMTCSKTHKSQLSEKGEERSPCALDAKFSRTGEQDLYPEVGELSDTGRLGSCGTSCGLIKVVMGPAN